MMKNLSTSIYTFESLISNDCLYVDKTRYLYELIKLPKAQVFCARPRRFGKSLTVSTLEAIFRGKRELFEGLYIGGQDYDWQEYPVVHLDFARSVMDNIDILKHSLALLLMDIGQSYGVEFREDEPALLFRSLVDKLHEKFGRGVVILIDEYDKPIFEHIEDREDAEEFRKFLSSFYQIIKGAEAKERFVFLTGVTRLAKLSIFSKLNNLFDITMDEDYATMMGYTQAEMESNFAGWLDKAMAEQVTDEFGELLDREGLLGELKRWYDGYCFAPGCETVYNPVSVGNFFLKKNAFRNYWFSTGTPRFLVELMQRNKMTLMDVTGARLPASSLDSFDVTELAGSEVRNERIVELMLQTGYLTLDYVLTRPQLAYVMRFPNAETEKSFGENLLNAYVKQRTPAAWSVDIWEAAERGDTEQFIKMLQGFFADISYTMQLDYEKFYQTVVYIICRMCGMDIQAEVATNVGRIDAILRAGQHLYIMEFKLDKTAGAALVQIDEKKYVQRYILPARKKGQVIHKLGINFSYAREDRNITEWQEELVR